MIISFSFENCLFISETKVTNKRFLSKWCSNHPLISLVEEFRPSTLKKSGSSSLSCTPVPSAYILVAKKERCEEPPRSKFFTPFLIYQSKKIHILSDETKESKWTPYNPKQSLAFFPYYVRMALNFNINILENHLQPFVYSS